MTHTVPRGRPRCAVGASLIAAAVGLIGCSGAAQIAVPRSWADIPDSVVARWTSPPDSFTAARCNPSLTAPADASSSFDIKELQKCAKSARHGTGDMRRLSNYDSKTGAVVTNGPIASIAPVAGVEDWPETFFRNPMPIAIIDVREPGPAYSKLGLQVGRNYWIVQKVGSTWRSWMQPQGSGGSPPPAISLLIEVPTGYDALAPTFSAQFVWDDHDEGLWGYCAGRCCQVRKTTAAPL